VSRIPPDPRSRGFLLPTGCKDLVDVLNASATKLRYDALRVNGQIHAEKVRLVGEQGQQLGIMSLADALDLARAREMDLVEFAPHGLPPVCRLLDYAAFCDALSKLRKSQK
jgi:translation initiation factor IF-3